MKRTISYFVLLGIVVFLCQALNDLNRFFFIVNLLVPWLALTWAIIHIPDLFLLTLRAEKYRLLMFLLSSCISAFLLFFALQNSTQIFNAWDNSLIILWRYLANYLHFTLVVILSLFFVVINYYVFNKFGDTFVFSSLFAGIGCFASVILAAVLPVFLLLLLSTILKSTAFFNAMLVISVMEMALWLIRDSFIRAAPLYKRNCPSCNKHVKFNQLSIKLCQCTSCLQCFVRSSIRIPDRIATNGALLTMMTILSKSISLGL